MKTDLREADVFIDVANDAAEQIVHRPMQDGYENMFFYRMMDYYKFLSEMMIESETVDRLIFGTLEKLDQNHPEICANYLRGLAYATTNVSVLIDNYSLSRSREDHAKMELACDKIECIAEMTSQAQYRHILDKLKQSYR